MQDDHHLLAQVRRGDAGALRDLYLKHKDALLTTAACLLPDRSAAEDVLHDVFVGLAENAATHDVRRNVRGYLVACVANRARDRLRRLSRGERARAHVLDRLSAEARKRPESSASSIDDAEARAVCAALHELPHEQREAIVLHLHGGLTFRQIARHQAIGTNTAKSRYRYGLDGLRARLEQGVGT